jgi:hypothetical protein
MLFAAAWDTGTVHSFDLRAIRAELKKLDLDWDAPSLPPASEPATGGPLQIEVDLGSPK